MIVWFYPDSIVWQETNSEVPHSWWCHQMEKFSALLAFVRELTGEFPAQRPVTRIFDVFFDMCLNKWLSKQS